MKRDEHSNELEELDTGESSSYLIGCALVLLTFSAGFASGAAMIWYFY